MTSTLHSSDGTAIAYETVGDGPPLVLVDGALCHRAFGPSRPLAALLAQQFTVYTYDRRGRGESGDSAPYAVEHEIEDLHALIDAAGGSASVYGISSGAVLALEAASLGVAMQQLALYEPPFIVDDSRAPMGVTYTAPLTRLLGEDRRGAAVSLFMRQVGLPAPMVAVMRLTPFWPKLKAVAHTLAYDAAIMGDTQSGNPLPADRWSAVTTPALVAVGGKSPAWLQNGTKALADVLPHARYESLDRQTHNVKAKALAPVLGDFFTSADRALAA